jgi:hypothetical protein
MRLVSFYSGNNQPSIFLLMNSNIHKLFGLELLFANNWSSDLICGCFRLLSKKIPIKNFALGI